MLQREADVVAKAIRNLRVPLNVKHDITDFIVYNMLKADQFFNHKRFRELAVLTLEDNYNNLTGFNHETDNPRGI